MVTEPSGDSGTALAVPEFLPDVRTGEVFPATAENAAQLLVIARAYSKDVANVVKECEAVLIEEFRQRGKSTLEFPAGKATMHGGPGKGLEWDMDILEELRDLGLPDDRFDELVVATVTYKVNAAVAKQLRGANPTYAEVIDRAERRPDTTARVYVR